MKYLIEWILKGLLTITFGAACMICLFLLALIMWDIRFFEMGESIQSLIWGWEKDNSINNKNN